MLKCSLDSFIQYKKVSSKKTTWAMYHHIDDIDIKNISTVSSLDVANFALRTTTAGPSYVHVTSLQGTRIDQPGPELLRLASTTPFSRT